MKEGNHLYFSNENYLSLNHHCHVKSPKISREMKWLKSSQKQEQTSQDRILQAKQSSLNLPSSFKSKIDKKLRSLVAPFKEDLVSIKQQQISSKIECIQHKNDSASTQKEIQLSLEKQQNSSLDQYSKQQESPHHIHPFVYGLKSKKVISSLTSSTEEINETNLTQKVAYLQNMIGRIAQFPSKQNYNFSMQCEISQNNGGKEQNRSNNQKAAFPENEHQSSSLQEATSPKQIFKKGRNISLNKSETSRNFSSKITMKEMNELSTASSLKNIFFLNQFTEIQEKISLKEKLNQKGEEKKTNFQRRHADNINQQSPSLHKKISLSPPNNNNYFQKLVPSKQASSLSSSHESPKNSKTFKCKFNNKVNSSYTTKSINRTAQECSIEKVKPFLDQSYPSHFFMHSPQQQVHNLTQSHGTILLQQKEMNSTNCTELTYFSSDRNIQEIINKDILQKSRLNFKSNQLLELISEHIKQMQKEYENKKKVNHLIFQMVFKIPFLIKMLFQDEKMILRDNLDFQYFYTFLLQHGCFKKCSDKSLVDLENIQHLSSINKIVKNDLMLLNDRLKEAIQSQFDKRFQKLGKDISNEHQQVQTLERSLERNLAQKNKIIQTKGNLLLLEKHNYQVLDSYSFINKPEQREKNPKHPILQKDNIENLGEFKGIDKRAIMLSHQIDNLYERISQRNEDNQIEINFE